MIVVLKPNIAKKQELAVLKEIRKLGYRPHVMRGVERTVIGAIGDERTHQTLETLVSLAAGRERHADSKALQARQPRGAPRQLDGQVAWQRHRRKKVSRHGRALLGRKREAIADNGARRSQKAGATILRGGAFKPRTSPYEFQGLGEKGLKLLDKARRETGLAIITELLSEQHAELVAEYADILQIGARNAQNFQLLIAAAKTGKPVLLKRGLSMKIEEWLLAGEYVLANENPQPDVLRARHSHVRDLHPQHARSLDHSDHQKGIALPIVIDPSQGAGRADLVAAMCKGAVAMGADALLIEVHPNPAEAWSDGAQQVSVDKFKQLMSELKPFIAAAGRE